MSKDDSLPSTSNAIVTKTFYKKTIAIIEPHVLQKSTKKPIEKKTTKRATRKRKSSTTEQEVKKAKISSRYNEARTDIRGLHQALDKRRSSVNCSATIDKAEKERLSNIRKTKLKEIAMKPPVAETATSSKPKTNAKVKISPSRGDFLLTELQAAPKRPKENEVQIKPPIPKLKLSKVLVPKQRNNQIASVPGTSGVSNIKNSNKKKRDLSIGSEIYQMLYWKPEWLVEQEKQDHCPPVNIKPAEKMRLKFASYAEYYSIVRPLLMMEIWDYVYKDYHDKNAK